MRFPLPKTLAVTALAVAAVTASAVVPQQALAADTTLQTQVFTDARTSILALAAKSSAADTQYFENGRFRYAGTTCYRCELGPAVAAAALFSRTGDLEMLNLALATFDAALRDQVQPNGSFSAGVPGEGSNLIQTTFFTEHLGSALFYLGGSLDATRRTAYVNALTNAADNLIATGMNTWYSNGNINLGVTVGLGMAAKFSGVTKYQTAYENALNFTLAPPQNRWTGFGLVLTTTGTQPLGRDSAGYLVERGTGGMGYDADYTMFQADLAAQGYQVIGDPRLLTLTNQLNNMELTQTNTTTWALNVNGGSRNPSRVGFDVYQSPALYIGATNGRPDMIALAESQVRATAAVMRASATTPAAGLYQAWGTRYAVDIAAVS